MNALRPALSIRPALSTVALGVVVGLLVVAGAVGPVAATGGPPATDEESDTVFDDPADLEAFVDDVIADERAAHDIPGATVAVVEGDETVLEKGYGEADADAGTPVQANETSFMIGSVGKLVTWTAVMQGVEDGTLDLDEDVNTYLEDSDVSVPETFDEPVTLRHLGTHTDGFDATPAAGLVTDQDEVTSLETALVEGQPDRVRPPGETVSYSNYGTMLAGHVVAEAHDTTFEAYVQSEIFEPLEMDHSTFAQPVPEDRPGELATPHRIGGDGAEPVDRTYINWRPAGAMSATSTDVAAFASAHLEDGTVDDAQVLEPETVDTMHEVHHERHPDLNGLRYGFYEYGPPDADLIAHSGGTRDETSKLVLAPEADVAVFVAYNVRTEGAVPNDVVDEILAAYDLESAGEPPRTAAAGEATATAPADTAQRTETVAGEYRTTMLPQDGPMQVLDPMVRLSLEATEDGHLESDIFGANEQAWVETEPYVFREVDGDDVLAADVEDGTVDALHTNSVPVTTYEPVATHERTFVIGTVAGGAILGFALSLLGWLGFAAWRGVARRRRPDGDSQSVGVTTTATRASGRVGFGNRLGNPAWLARAAAGALCVVSLAFVGTFLWAIGTDGDFAFVAMSLQLQAALALVPFVALLAAATVVGTGLAWSKSYWSRRARVHQTVLAVLGIAFTWLLFQFGLLGV